MNDSSHRNTSDAIQDGVHQLGFQRDILFWQTQILSGLNCNGNKFIVSIAPIRDMGGNVTSICSFMLLIMLKRLRGSWEYTNHSSLNKGPSTAGTSRKLTLTARMSETRMTSPPACMNAANKSAMQRKKVSRRKTMSWDVISIDVVPENITCWRGETFRTHWAGEETLSHSHSSVLPNRVSSCTD